MKQFLFFLAVVACWLPACTPNNTDEYELVCDIDAEALDSIYANFGQVHNDGLVDFYTYLTTSHPTAGSISQTKIVEVIFDGIDPYTSGIDESDFEVDFQIFSDDDFGDYTFEYIAEEMTRQDFNLSEDFEDAVAELKDIIYNGTNVDAETFDDFIDIYLPLVSDCTEKVALAGMASVARESYNYWEGNEDDWIALGIQDLTQLQPRWGGRGKDIVWADAAGAGTGALAGAYIGLTAGTFVVPIIGTAVGGAGGVMAGMLIGSIGGSAGAGLHALAQWAIGW